MQYGLNAFYTKLRLPCGLLADKELFEKMFPTMLDMKDANKAQKKFSKYYK